MLEVERRSLQENFQKAVDELQKQSEAVQLLSDGSADLETKTRELADLQRINSEIKNRLDKLRLEKDTTERIISERDPHQSETSDWLLKVAEVVAVFVMSLAATVFGIAIWDYRKHLVNQADDVTGMFGPRVLGALPQLSGGRLLGRASQEKVTSALNDSIDSIRTQFLYDKSEHPVRVIMVTSAVGQEGKTTVASQLAASLASAGRSTLLLDGDLRNPQQHLVWGASNDRGMCELIRGQATLDDVVRPTESEGLWLVPGGICDQAALQALTSETMDTLFDQLRARYDFVVIDAGPALVGADPLLIGQFADGTVLSVRRDVSQLRKVHDANDRLRSVGIDVVGTVVNGALPEIRKVG